MLQIEHLTKTYGEKKAVDDLSLHILPGEIYGFIGHNGAGKTTTLKSVAGILRFDAGEIRIAGTSIRTDPLACKRKLAYIPDNPDLYDYDGYPVSELYCEHFRRQRGGPAGAHPRACGAL